MITFQAKNPLVQNADRITRSANSVYPHLTESRISKDIEDRLDILNFNSPVTRHLLDLKLKLSTMRDFLRTNDYSGMDLFRHIINMLKNYKIGNCYELSRLSEIIAKINGQDNIYPMKIFISRNRSGVKMPLDHVVSVITQKQIYPNKRYSFKNKDAIILDPWFGTTDFASGYMEKLKYDFNYKFDFMPDSSFTMRMASRNAKNLQEYKDYVQQNRFNPNIEFMLHDDEMVTKEQAKILRNEYPEFILEKFKKVEL